MIEINLINIICRGGKARYKEYNDSIYMEIGKLPFCVNAMGHKRVSDPLVFFLDLPDGYINVAFEEIH